MHFGPSCLISAWRLDPSETPKSVQPLFLRLRAERVHRKFWNGAWAVAQLVEYFPSRKPCPQDHINCWRWHNPVIPEFGKRRVKGYEFKVILASLGCASSCLKELPLIPAAEKSL